MNPIRRRTALKPFPSYGSPPAPMALAAPSARPDAAPDPITPPATPQADPRSATPPPPTGRPRHAADQPPEPFAQPSRPPDGPTGPGGAPAPAIIGADGEPVPDYANYSDARNRPFGRLGLSIGLIGIAAVAIGFSALDWLSGGDGFGGTTKVTFNGLRTLTGLSPSGWPKAYFGGLGWTLLALTTVLLLLATLPTRAQPIGRTLGALTGVAGAGLTYVAVYQGFDRYQDVFTYGGVGFWVTISGFGVVAIGAIIGPR
jgi:hypothetical protein